MKSVQLAHGSGGQAMQQLIGDLFMQAFANPWLAEQEDQARLDLAQLSAQGDRLAFSTDSYVIDPLFFPGGNIGKLAVCGTANDVAVSGALPLWLDNDKWIIKDGWFSNPGPMTMRLDKDTADALVADNVSAGAAINWLRYMEISHSWTKINLDNLGVLTMQSTVTGNSRVDGKVGTVNLNYIHEENVFTLWRSLRFGDNLQAWLEQNAALPETHCPEGKECEEQQ